MSNATHTIRDAAVILRDPYGRDPAALQETADALDKIAGIAEEFDLESLLSVESDTSSNPTPEQVQVRRLIPQTLRSMGFGRVEGRSRA